MNFETGNIKKILIIKFSAIGDVLMATPAIRAIRKKYPKAKICLLIGQWSKEAAVGNPNIDEFIIFDDTMFREHRIIPTISLIWKLRGEKFDLAINTHRSKALNIFTFLIGARMSVGFDRNFGKYLLANAIKEDKTMHEIDKYLLLVEAQKERNKNIDIFLSEDDEEFAKKFLSDNGIVGSDTVIGMGPGGAKNPGEDMSQRRWPTEYYAELSDTLISNKNIKVLFFGNKADSLIVKQIKDKMKHKAIDVSGKTTLKQAAALIKRCAVFVTHDCGLLHVAAAQNIPIISIFGPTDPKEKAPLGKEYFYAGIKCSPCYLNGNFPDCKDVKCMKSIQPNDVLAAIEKILTL